MFNYSAKSLFSYCFASHWLQGLLKLFSAVLPEAIFMGLDDTLRLKGITLWLQQNSEQHQGYIEITEPTNYVVISSAAQYFYQSEQPVQASHDMKC